MTPEDFAALSKVIEALGPLESHDAKRVLYAAAVFFGMLTTEELVLDDPNFVLDDPNLLEPTTLQESDDPST